MTSWCKKVLKLCNFWAPLDCSSVQIYFIKILANVIVNPDVKFMEIDIPRKRIGLSMRLDDDVDTSHKNENPKNKPYIPYTNIFNNTYISKDHYHYVSIDESEDDLNEKIFNLSQLNKKLFQTINEHNRIDFINLYKEKNE